MRNIVGSATVAFLFACSAAACSQSKQPSSLYSASRLVQECRATISDFDSDKAEIGSEGQHCLGYVQGFTEMGLMWQVANKKIVEAKTPMYCLTTKVTNEVIIRRIPVWAIEHPGDIKDSALEFLLSMLVGSYPCAK